MHTWMGRWAGSAGVLAVGLSFAGCGESDTNDSTEETNDATDGSSTNTAGSTGTDEEGLLLFELPMAYGTAYCSWIFRCCPTEQIQHIADSGVTFYGTTETECQTNMAALVLFVIPNITEAESQGRSRYDALDAAACIDKLRTTCDDIESICEALVDPLVEPGGACSSDDQCIGGLKCIGETANGEDPSEGTCAAALGLGEECEDDSECASTVCSDTCVEPAALGETCFSDSTCTSAYCDAEADTCAEAPYATSCKI